jgi:uncharacterized protein YbbC (DUF1343 family)
MHGRRISGALFCLLAMACPLRGDPHARLPRVDPAAAGIPARLLEQIDPLVAGAMEARQLPGCVVLVLHRGQIIWLKAYGHCRLAPHREEMTVDTVFDLASLTKPVATAVSVLQLVERGQLRLNDAVARHWPEFAAEGKESITIEQLLVHQGGLIPDNDLADYADGPDQALERLARLRPSTPPGTRFRYSDVGFIVLGEVVRRVSGQNLQDYTQQHVFGPLGMSETGFLPAADLRRRAAPTEQRQDRWLQGEVHDPRAALLGGVAGHAGLFSTAEDLAVFAQALLDGGRRGPVRVLTEESLALMTARHPVSAGARGLGWDLDTGFSINRGELMSPRAFGHGGFTGTSLWIDPPRQLAVIFLSNRLHPDGRGSVNPLAGRIGSLASAAVLAGLPPTAPATADTSSASPPDVLTGIDVLVRDRFAQLAGRRVGLVTNHTGRSRDGSSTAALLQAAPGVQLVALFSPEHGLAGKQDQPRIDDARDPATGLKVSSLFGPARRPSAESLVGIDTLVFDLQDAGARFYTYPATLVECLRAAAEHRRPFVVLDRPNPLGGAVLAGPLLDAGRESFTAFHRVPVRHGLTLGEIARLVNAELGLGADLQVIPLEGWRRGMFFDQTGLPWTGPSPNLRSMTAALLYPGIGLLETTNVSVGRGTDRPFELVGAPWIDGPRLAAGLLRAGLPGVSCVAVRFTPRESVFAGQECQGVELLVTDRQRIEPLAVGLELAAQLRDHPGEPWQIDRFGRLLEHADTLRGLRDHQATAALVRSWSAGLAEFDQRRQPYLLYPE